MKRILTFYLKQLYHLILITVLSNLKLLIFIIVTFVLRNILFSSLFEKIKIPNPILGCLNTEIKTS
jgi:hypothetical protein